jgi:hypothetical protein
MTGKKIRDLPKHRKALDEADGLIGLAKIAKSLAPVLPKKAREALANFDPAQFEDARRNMEQLAALPDRFNNVFAERGWVMFEDMNADVALEAVELAEAGKPEESERILVDFWTTDMIRVNIARLKRINAFPARWRLAVDAETLYGQEHYHACTLMVLAVLDGMVQETCARHLGVNQNFSAEKTVLEAWDSIAGHSTALAELKKLMLSPRKKTNQDPVPIPYRHGIMHGMDVNFNTRLVAAKTWAALFAVGEWAYLAQQGKLTEPPPEPAKPAIKELVEAGKILKETQELKDAAQAFKPRTLWEEGGIPTHGAPEDYGPGTPERAVVEFLTSWQASNYGKMANAITTIGKEPEKPANLRSWFDTKELESFEITKVVDEGIARSVVSVSLSVKSPRKQWNANVDVVLIKKLQSGRLEEIETCPWTFFNYYDLAREPMNGDS